MLYRVNFISESGIPQLRIVDTEKTEDKVREHFMQRGYPVVVVSTSAVSDELRKPGVPVFKL